MTGKSFIIAVLAVFFMTFPVLVFGGGGGGGGGAAGAGVPVDLLLPDPPRNVTASAGDGTATVSFEAPKSDGGSPVTYYTVTSVPRGIPFKGSKSPIVVRGLTNGKTYAFTVRASNSVGTGLTSSPSNCVTPGK